MIVDPEVLKDIYLFADTERLQRAKDYKLQNRINIYKVMYENSKNFTIRSKVKGNFDEYEVYVKVKEGELEDANCSCEDYHQNYVTCKHILGSIMEFAENEKYIRIFAGEQKQKEGQDDVSIYKGFGNKREDEKYRNFRQLMNTFYNKKSITEEDINLAGITKTVATSLPHTIKIEPKIIYNNHTKNIKLEFRIGSAQLYKLKSLPEFYERILKEENYKYGSKLTFIHKEEFFEEDSIPLLHYILKYAEIIKYANESAGAYGYYGRTMADSYITVSNSGLDELFEILKNKEIIFQQEYEEKKLEFIEKEPEIAFTLIEKGKKEYGIKTNIDIYEYELLEGKEYTYFLTQDKLYKCNKEFKENVIKLLQVFRNNFTTEINFKKEDLPELFSVVFPKVRQNIDINNLEAEEIEKYIPQELAVKIYLDFDKRNYITADIRFIYGETEFNPFSENDLKIPRDISKEDENLEMFLKSGFMLDTANNRLILVKEEAIYQFLTQDIEQYMQKFEVLATENFKTKEIKQPKTTTLGVKIENNLLKIDLSQLDFDPSELKEIMQKYKLKRKYHRLKDGSFLELEDNETMEFLNSVTEDIGIDYKEIESGELKLPVFRSMYLDRLLQNLKGANITKNAEYKTIVNKIEEKQITEEVKLPSTLKANLRNYQKVGFEWLKILDEYKFGGILADDMGLGKTIQLIAIIASYVEESKENSKPSMVVCPSSLTLNWESEIKKFAPKLTSIVIHGNAEERRKQIKSIRNYDIAITSYDLLKRDVEVYEEVNYQFQYIIADEAQYIKNNNTQNAKAIKKINAATKYALTGTPIENSLSEIWSIFDFIMPGYLFHYRKFKELYETPIVKDNDETSIRKLKMLIEPFVLRRVKKEVLTELPDKTITVLKNQMQEEQQKIYLSYMQNAKQEALEEIKTNGIGKSQIKILSLLMRLRQICCHPSLFIEDYKGESSKLGQCMEIVKDAIGSGHKILLFSTYTGMFEILQKELEKEKISYFKLTGQTKVSERIKLVDEFNENNEIKVFLISLKAGGTGLNLIGADMVIHYDPWWNLSAENQATDRTYRIGQKKNVQVYKLITQNSIEEKIYELQQKKAKLIDNMLSTNETFINRLSKEDVMKLFD